MEPVLQQLITELKEKVKVAREQGTLDELDITKEIDKFAGSNGGVDILKLMAQEATSEMSEGQREHLVETLVDHTMKGLMEKLDCLSLGKTTQASIFVITPEHGRDGRICGSNIRHGTSALDGDPLSMMDVNASLSYFVDEMEQLLKDGNMRIFKNRMRLYMASNILENFNRINQMIIEHAETLGVKVGTIKTETLSEIDPKKRH